MKSWTLRLGSGIGGPLSLDPKLMPSRPTRAETEEEAALAILTALGYHLEPCCSDEDVPHSLCADCRADRDDALTDRAVMMHEAREWGVR